MRRTIVASLFMLFSLHASAFAEEFTLVNGDRVTGEVLKEDLSFVTIRTPGMGDVTIRRDFVKQRTGAGRGVGTTLAQAAEAVRRKPDWQREASFGYDRRGGNTDTTDLNARFKASKKTARTEFRTRVDFHYAKFRRKMNAQRLYGNVYWAPYLDKAQRWYNFYKAEADKDRFANVDARVTPSTGFGYWFWKGEDFRLLAEMGAGFTYTNFRDVTEDRTEIVLVPRLYFEKKLWGKTKFTQDLLVYPSLSHSGEFRVKSESILQTEIFQSLSLRTGVIDEYNSDPAALSRNNDFRFISAIVYSF